MKRISASYRLARRAISLAGWLAILPGNGAWASRPGLHTVDTQQGSAAPQETMEQKLRERVSRAGVFFRADAPWALRNPDDPYLPVFLEIINGVEKTGHSAASRLAQYVKRDPIQLEGVDIYVKPSGGDRQYAPDPLLPEGNKDFTFDARAALQPLVIPDRMKKTLEIPLATIQSYLARHFVGGPFDAVDVEASFRVIGWPDQSFYLRVRLKAALLPHLPRWYRGDLHYHSGYTDNPAERGYPLGVTKQAALDAGLDWLLLSDHSTDLSPQTFEEELQEVKGLRDGRLVFIRGEEVTVSSAKTAELTTLHLLALPSPDDPDKGFPGAGADSTPVMMTGDGSPGSPPMPLKDALARIVGAGGFAYAAHPFDPVSPIVRGGAWDIALDFQTAGAGRLPSGLVGLEPWNRATLATADEASDPYCLRIDAVPSACFQPDQDANQYVRLKKGIDLGWRPLLRAGLQPENDAANSLPRKVFMAAGSDAHGDFNFEATLDALDFLSKPTRGISGYAEDNALGKLSTVVYCPEGMGRRGENVLGALRDGHSVMTNGPLLIAGFDVNANGSLDDPEDVGIGQQISSAASSLPPLQIQWASSDEFGPIHSLRLIVGISAGESEPIELSVPPNRGLASGWFYPVNLQSYLAKLGNNWGYLRLEATTRNSSGEEFRCYTNPIWVRVTGP